MTAPPELLGPHGRPLGPDGQELHQPLGADGQPLLGPDGRPALLAATPGGLPYPVPSDPIANGATNIQALATALDPHSYGVYRSAAANLANGAWTVNPAWSQAIPGWPNTPGWVTNAGGVVVPQAGLYHIYAWATANNATSGGGRRGITVGTNTALYPAGPVPTPIVPATGGGQTVLIALPQNLPAGAIVAPWMYQDSGSTITASNWYLVLRLMH